MIEGNLPEAVDRYRAALALLQKLRDPAWELKGRNGLAHALFEAGQYDEAEEHCREAARIEEARGNPKGAGEIWVNLAVVAHAAGKLDVAEMWCRKALGVQDVLGTEHAIELQKLVEILRTQSGRLADVRLSTEPPPLS
jgi:tetratricopeptide (TPR) repeat protein